MPLIDDFNEFVHEYAPKRKEGRHSREWWINTWLYVGFWLFLVFGLIGTLFLVFAVSAWFAFLLPVWAGITVVWFLFGSWHAKKYDS